MLSYFKLDLSNQEILYAILFGFGVFFVFRVVLKRLLQASKLHSIKKIIPALEGVMWLVYLAWLVHQAGGGELDYLASLTFVVLVIGFIAWFALKDFIAGIIIKFDGLYSIGDRVSIGSTKGIITMMGFRAMRLKLPSGEEASMPYGQVLGKTHAKQPRARLAYSRRFHIRLSSELPLEQLLQAFRQSLSDAPWWIPNRNPKVEVNQWQDGVADLDVQVHALSTDDFLKIIHYACKQFGEFQVEEAA